MFFSFDGIDGVGKTTQMTLFCDWLREQGEQVVTCRDPGSTTLGERIREILLHSDESVAISARSEMLLYMAARAQLVEETIRPALAAGQTVVSDRFLLANLVYQGHAGGLAIEAIRTVGSVAVAGVLPDATFLLDMDPAVAQGRLRRNLDRMERRGLDYRRQLRAGFLKEAASTAETTHVIDADRPVEEVQTSIRRIAGSLLLRRERQQPS